MITIGFLWTAERVEMLKAHHAGGLSASQSAAILGVTRNSVIGKWARLGLPKRRKEAPPKPPKVRPGRIFSTICHQPIGAVSKLARTAQPEKQFDSKLSADDIPRQQRRSFDRLEERHCRWPYGDPGKPDFFYCGAVRKDPHIPIGAGGVPYCAGHCQTAYVGTGRSLGGLKVA